MVNSYRESINEYKDERSKRVDDYQHKRFGKKDKPVEVEYVWLKDFGTTGVLSESDYIWHRWKNYIDTRDAETAIKQHLRKHPGLFAFRLNGKIYKE